ncbi:MAG: hypothetical protein H6703_02585 [Myxococcales bacterium]|nr:hypothetical protein [Myxococcales bacterium]MCB9553583.1 hypothetical protein [Myxococcales bacterium]
MVSGNDQGTSCGGVGGDPEYGYDMVVSYTAPVTGRVQFDTLGTDPERLDTVLAVRTDCEDELSELACNDDYGDFEAGESQSVVIVELVAGQTVYLIVDSLSGADRSPFVLNASPVAGLPR